jgi:Fic family protein
MIWNWQRDDWPHFTFKKSLLDEREARFLRQSGVLLGSTKHINDDDSVKLQIDLMTNEAFKTSEIEGEFLNRDSLHSSIRRPPLAV